MDCFERDSGYSLPPGLSDKGERLYTLMSEMLSEKEQRIKALQKALSDEKRERADFREAFNELLSIQKMSEIIASAKNVSEIVRALIKIVRTVVNFESCGFFVFSGESRTLKPLIQENLSASVSSAIQSHFDDGIVDWTVSSGKPAFIPDMNSAYMEGGSPSKNFIVVPLIVRNEGIGVFEIYTSAGEDTVTSGRMELLNLISNQAALAIANTRLHNDQQKRIVELNALFEISNEISMILDTKPLLDKITSLSSKSLGNMPVAFYLYDDDSDSLNEAASAEFEKAGVIAKVLNSEKLIPGIFGSKGVLIIDANRSYRYKPLLENTGLKSFLLVPVFCKQKKKGIIVAASGEKDASEIREISGFMKTVASQASTALFNSILYNEIMQANVSLKETQNQLIQSSKLAAVGQLAGGIAHEINNPLQIILGRVQKALMKTKEEHTAGELKIVEGETKRIARIVMNLLDFSRERKISGEFISLDAGKVVTDTLALVQHHLDQDLINVEKLIQPGPNIVRGDANLLKQVFLNIINNARYAMRGGGTLKIEVRSTIENVLLSFSDTGPGISKSILGKIWDPFFTTKPVKEGTGLGLSITYNIIEKHGGSISADSEVGKGTVFRIKLPFYRGRTLE
ncbi:MAG: ATP-binding protein [Fibrobacterota bacterium]